MENELKVEVLWVKDWYDGPLYGICEYQGRMFYFDVFDQSDFDTKPGWYRKYYVYNLSDSEIAHEVEYQSRYCESVGNNYDFRVPYSERIVHPEEKWPEFLNWEKQYPEVDYRLNHEIVGYFVD